MCESARGVRRTRRARGITLASYAVAESDRKTVETRVNEVAHACADATSAIQHAKYETDVVVHGP